MPRKQRFKPSRKPKPVDAPQEEETPRSPGDSGSHEPVQPPDLEEDHELGGESG